MALFGGICSFAFLFINIPADMVIVLFFYLYRISI